MSGAGSKMTLVAAAFALLGATPAAAQSGPPVSSGSQLDGRSRGGQPFQPNWARPVQPSAPPLRRNDPNCRGALSTGLCVDGASGRRRPRS